MKTLGDIGELDAIRRICSRLPGRRDILTGAGDDCAVVRSEPGATVDLLLTSDPVIENVHFSPSDAPEHIGHKAIGRLLSDIAAMGGDPLWCLIDIAAPPSTPVERIERFYDGALAHAKKHGLAIVGGDLATGGALEIHAFAAGSVPAGQAILRSGARPSDLLYVTGALGGSFHGKHLSFEPRLREGRWLRGLATSMIDVSDGLASDLRHLTGMSRTGAELWIGGIPISDAARQHAAPFTPLQRAFRDGEDFELLFTVPEALAADMERRWAAEFDIPCGRIGSMTDLTGEIVCVAPDGSRTPLAETGFEHFHPQR
jgi:thiamine-monophosphate kinase